MFQDFFTYHDFKLSIVTTLDWTDNSISFSPEVSTMNWMINPCIYPHKTRLLDPP